MVIITEDNGWQNHLHKFYSKIDFQSFRSCNCKTSEPKETEVIVRSKKFSMIAEQALYRAGYVSQKQSNYTTFHMDSSLRDGYKKNQNQYLYLQCSNYCFLTSS